MIKKSEIKRIKKIIGKSYASKIIAFFKEKEYKREGGTDYINQDIYNFFGGRYDLTLHIKIMEVVEHYQRLNEQLRIKQEELLQNKKPEAATPGQ